MRIPKPSNAILLLSALGIYIAVLLTDVVTPLGYTHWVLYVLPLLIVYLTENEMMTYLLIAILPLALTVGYIQSPQLPSFEDIRVVSLINRIAGFGVLLIFSTIISKVIQARKHYRLLAHQLEYANKELESFSYSAAHDLKSPLRAMNGFGRILLEEYGENLDQKAKNYLERIVKSSERMSSLVDDMLSLSKISLQEIDLQEVDMSAIAESIVAELRSTAPQRKVEVHIDKGMKARGDGKLLNIAMANLIGNAWKYTSKKELARISIQAKYGKNETTFSVKDNGSGFDMKFAGNLFVPLKRLHSESEFQGTGIGLSIVDRVIRRHRGRVWAESELDKGATFYFTLPR